MACCKACCGCADCSEGQQGKCCCGGASGSCCSASEYCCSGACQGTPCDEPCTVDEDCYFCEDPSLTVVDPCDGAYSTAKKCCPEGSVAWVDDPGDPRQGNCVSDCAPGDNVILGVGVAVLGYCCDGACQQEECESPVDVFTCPSSEDCCAAEGLVYVGVDGTGKALCCQEDWTYDAPNLSCNPPGYSPPP